MVFVAEHKDLPGVGAVGAGCFKEAVCINANRIYDSCSEKDCVEGMVLYFTSDAQPAVNGATGVRCREVTLLGVDLDVDSVPFNKGFYSVDMTFYVKVDLELVGGCPCDTQASGLGIYTKKVILYGSEGNVNVFSSDNSSCGLLEPSSTSPIATVKVANPICLAHKLCDTSETRSVTVNVPNAIAAQFGASPCGFAEVCVNKIVLVTLGIFSIVSLERKVQMMIPVYDYSLPDKECLPVNDSPCEMFKRIKFPVDEFFPPRLNESGEN